MKGFYSIIVLLIFSTPVHSQSNLDLKGVFFELDFIDPLTDSQIDSESYRGNFLIINFWYSDCSPCQNITAEFKEIYDNYHPKGVNFIGINLDPIKGDFIAYCEVNGIEWPQFYDGFGSFSKSLGITSVPLFLIVDKDGTVLEHTFSFYQLKISLDYYIR